MRRVFSAILLVTLSLVLLFGLRVSAADLVITEAGSQVSITALTTASQRVALPTSSSGLWYIWSSSASVYYRTGDGTVVALTTDPVLPAGVGRIITVETTGDTYIAAYAVSGSGHTLFVYPVTIRPL